MRWDNREKALAMMVVLTVTMAFWRFDPLGLMSLPLEEVAVTSCDGETIRLDGREAELLRLHNEARVEHALEEFCVRKKIRRAAKDHSEDMIQRDFYAHEDPDGVTASERLSRAGYPFSGAAENISRASDVYSAEPGRDELGEVFEGWMNSEGHRKNLLNPKLREIGIGITTGDYAPNAGKTTMYTVDFGTLE